mgnify:CR=1 FL=1
MPPVVAFLTAAVTGLFALTGAAAVVAWSAVIIGASLAVKALIPKVNMGVVDGDRARQTTVRSTIEPRKLIYGETMVSGVVSFAQVDGANNKNLHQVIAIAGHKLTSIDKIYFDDYSINLSSQVDGSGDVTSGTFAKKTNEDGTLETMVHIETRDGSSTQTAYSGLVTAFAGTGAAAGTGYESTHRGDNVASIYTRWTIHEGTTETWDEVGGIQNIKAVVKGKAVYDPRLDVTAGNAAGANPTTAAYIKYSDGATTATHQRDLQGQNPALMLADYLMDDKFGLGLPATKIDWPAVVAAADACDFLVPIPVSQTQKRFFGSGVIFGSDNHRKSISKILSGMNGDLIYSQGKYIIKAGVHETSSLAITEDDLAGDFTVKTSIPRADRFNTIKGMFIDPASNYKMTEFAPRTVSGAVARDNEVLEEEIKLTFTSDRYAAQRIAIKKVHQSFLQTTLSLPVNLKGMKVAVGDRITLALNDFATISPDWNPSKEFKVIGWSFSESGNGAIDLSLVEDDADRYVDPAEGDYNQISNTGVITSSLAPVPSPTNFTATAGYNSVNLAWTNPTDTGTWEQIWIFASDTATPPATPIEKFRGTSFTHQIAGGTAKYYWIQAVKYPLGSTPASGSTNTAKSALVPFGSPTAVTALKIANAVMATDSIDTAQIITDAVGSNQIAQTLQSSNWSVPNETGWQINKNGDTTFNNTVVRGNISATTGTVGGFTIGSTNLIAGDEATRVSLSTADGISLGDNTFADAPFSVTPAGALTATNATITGSISATTGAIGGFDIGTDYIADAADSMGLSSTVTAGDDVRFWAGETFANRATAPFRVTELGVLTATSATITGAITATSGTFTGTVNASAGAFTGDVSTDSKFIAGSGATSATMDGGDQNYKFYAGAATAGASPFKVDASGTVTADRIVITRPNDPSAVIFDSAQDGLVGVGLSSLASGSDTAVSQVADELTSDTDYARTILSATQNLTIKTLFPLGYLPFAINSAEDFPDSITLTLQVANIISGVVGTFGDVSLGSKTFTRRTLSGSASDDDYYSVYASGTGWYAGGKDAIDSQFNLVMTKTFVSTPADRAYRVQVSYVAGSGSSTANPSSSSNRTLYFNSSSQYFTIDSNNVIRDQAAGSLLTGDVILTASSGTRSISWRDSDTQDETFSIVAKPDINESGSNTLFIKYNNSTTAPFAFVGEGGNFLAAGSIYADGAASNSTQWKTGYDYSQIGHLPLTGGTISQNLTITGDLTVNGTTTTVNTDNLTVKDNNITLNYSTGDSSSTANNAGITIQDAVSVGVDSSILFKTASDTFEFSHGISSGAITSNGNIALNNTTTYGSFTLAGGQTGGVSYALHNAIPGVANGGFSIRRAGSVNTLAFDTSDNATFAGAISSGALTSTGNSSHGGYSSWTAGSGTGGIFMHYNATNSYRGYFDWRTLQLGNNGANNILAGNTGAGGWFDFWVNATAISQAGGTSGIKALTLTAAGNTIARGTLSSGDITIEVDDTPTLNFKKASSADVLASINVTTDTGSGGKLVIQTKRDGDTAVDRLTIDNAGNMGLGVVPSSWNGNNTALQVGAAACIFGSTNTSLSAVSANAYFDSTNSRYEYISSDFATLYQQLDGAHSFSTAASGTADAAISWTTAMTIDNSANVLVGKTTDAFGTAGIALRGTVADFTRDGGTPINVNRLTNDGSLIILHKAGINIGAIGVSGGNNLFISGNAASHGGLTFATQSVLPTTEGTINNALVSLGQTGNAFKDLFLTGSVVGGAINASLGLYNSAGSDSGSQQAFWAASSGVTYQAGYQINWNTGGNNARTTKMLLTSSGNLLVGGTSTNPTGQNVAGAAIDASGEGNFSVAGAEALRLNRKTDDGDVLKVMKDGATVGSIGVASSDNMYITSTATNHVGLYLGGGGVLPMNSGAIDGGDNVDIGSPNYQFADLHLSGAITASNLTLTDDGVAGGVPLLRISADDASPWALQLYREDLSGGPQMYASDASTFSLSGNLDLRAGFSLTMNGSTVIDSSKNISVGTVTANPTGGQVTLGTNGFITSKQSLDVATAGGRFVGESNRGALGWIQIEQTTTGADGGYIKLATSASGSTSPTERVRINQEGNVGIGTSSIEGRLHVYNGASGKSYATDGADQLILENNSSVLMDIRTPAGDTGGIIFSDADARARGVIQYAHSTDAMYFNTAGASAMIIDASGRVSIGRSSDVTAKCLELQPPAQISDFGSYILNIGGNEADDAVGTKSGIGFGYTSTARPAAPATIGYETKSTGGGTYGDIYFATRATGGTEQPTERLRIDASGNVGINAVPEAWHSAFPSVLQVGAMSVLTSGGDNARIFGNAYYDGAYKRINTGYAQAYEQTAGEHRWYNAASGAADSTLTWSEFMRLDAGGTLTLSADTTHVINLSAVSTTIYPGISFNNKAALSATQDGWLRLNQTGQFTNGVYTPLGLRADGGVDSYAGYKVIGTSVIDASRNLTAANGNFSGIVGVNKATSSSVGLSVGSDASTSTSYGLEVCNSTSNTRFLVDGLGNSNFYGSDNSVSMSVESSGNVTIQGPIAPSGFALLNIGSSGSGETRAIDIDGGWSVGESKAISFTHGTSATALVGQIKAAYNNPGSSLEFGRLYHSGDSSFYPLQLNSTSTTSADLNLSGNFKISGTTVIDSSRNITGTTIEATSKLYLNRGNYEGQIIFGAASTWRVGISQYDNSDAEMRIWARNANGRVHIVTDFNGETATTKPADGLVVDHNNVGIGNFSTTDPTEKLHVKGNILASGNVTAYSDERLKSDIQTLDGKKVLQMRGVSFTKDGVAGSGVIAQELELVASELVSDGEYKSVAYGNITGYLIEAIKDQQSEIDELKTLVKKLMEK